MLPPGRPLAFGFIAAISGRAGQERKQSLTVVEFCPFRPSDPTLAGALVQLDPLPRLRGGGSLMEKEHNSRHHTLA